MGKKHCKKILKHFNRLIKRDTSLNTYCTPLMGKLFVASINAEELIRVIKLCACLTLAEVKLL